MSKELKLVHNDLPLFDTVNALDDVVCLLEAAGGNLDVFLEQYQPTPHGSHDQLLFRLEQQFQDPNNAEYKKRWQSALALSAKIRMDRLRSKAFKLLEGFTDETGQTAASVINFGKAVLIGQLTEEVAIVRSKFRPVANAGPTSNDDQDDADYEDVNKEFDEAEEFK